MTASTIPPHRLPGAGIGNRFNVPAYIAWAAVAGVPVWHAWHGAAPLSITAVVSFVGMLALFMLRAAFDARDFPAAARRATILGQFALALLAYSQLRDELTLVLVVICAAQVGCQFSARGTALVLLGANIALLLLTLHYQPMRDPIAAWIAFASFQAFVAMGSRFAARLMETQEVMKRINAELLSTRQLLDESARADERLRLSRELHDVAGHKLTALKMQLAAHGLRSNSEAVIKTWEQIADELLTDIRGVVSALRQHEGVDLQQALRALDPGLVRPRVHFDIDPRVRVADVRQAEGLLRSAQEGLTNALRHSSATRISLSLVRTHEGIELRVEDNGRGRAEHLRVGNGLQGLEERLREIGGRLLIANAEPDGIVLCAVLPERRDAEVLPVPAVGSDPADEVTTGCAVRESGCAISRRISPAALP